MSEKKNSLDLDWSTLVFILLTIATCGLLYWLWVWKFIKKVSTPLAYGTNKVLTILLFAFYGWSNLIVLMAIESGDFGLIIFVGGISQILALAYIVFLEILTFKTKTDYEQYLSKQGTSIKLNGFLLFIFPFYYQYYVAYNALAIANKQRLAATPVGSPTTHPDDGDVSTKLEKLASLKASGAITEEQFEAAKKKLLS